MPRTLPIVLVLLLTLSSVAAPAAAQDQGGWFPSDYLRMDLQLDRNYVEVPWKGQTVVNLTIRDFSGDEGRFQHQVLLRADIVTSGNQGWTATVSPPAIFTYAGESETVQLIVRASPVTTLHSVTVNITAEMHGSGGSDSITRTTQVQTRLVPYHLGILHWQTTPPRMEPDETRTLEVEVTNAGPYPDVFALRPTAPPGWDIQVQPRVGLNAGETTTVEAQLRAPNDRLYYWTETAVLTMGIRSINDPTGTEITRNWVATVQGAYLPGYMVPLLPLLLVLVGAVVVRGRDRWETRRLERGKPREPEPSPREAALLAALKQRNPEAYEEKQARLEEEYAARKALYPDHKEKQLEPLPVPGREPEPEPAPEPAPAPEAEPEEPEAEPQPEPEGPEPPPDGGTGERDPEARRRELLERKRELLLERKREMLQRRIEERRRELEESGSGGDDGGGGS